MKAGKKMHDQEAYAFCSQLALILHTGIPIIDGLQVMDQGDMDSQLIHQIKESLILHGTLSKALEELNCFDHYVLSMIEIGERSGNLDEVMDALSSYFKQNMEIREKIKEVVSYPLFLLLIMIVVIGVIVIKVLPIFQNVLHALGTELSPLALTLLTVGTAIGQYGFCILCVLIGLIGFFLVYRYYQHRKHGYHDPLQSIFFRGIGDKIAVGRLTYALNLLLSSGCDMQGAMALLPGLVDHPKTLQRLEACQQLLAKGERLEDALMESQLYEGLYAKMLYMGFRRGSGEKVLKEIAELCDQDIDRAVTHYLNIVEPAVVITLSVVVGIILMSVMLPLLSIMSTIS